MDQNRFLRDTEQDLRKAVSHEDIRIILARAERTLRFNNVHPTRQAALWRVLRENLRHSIKEYNTELFRGLSNYADELMAGLENAAEEESGDESST